MDELDIERRVTVNAPPMFEVAPGIHGGDEITVREWLNLPAYFTTADDGVGLQLTKKELIAVWAQQSGGAHEDWEHDEVFVRLRNSGVFIAGEASDAAVLRGLAATVLEVAHDVLAEIDNQASEPAE